MLQADVPDVPAAAGVHRPRAVHNAARLMIAIAGVNLISLVVFALTIDEVRRLLRDATPTPSSAAVDTAVRVTALGFVAFVVAFPLLTRHVTRGRNWARIATWLLAAFGIVTTLQRLGRHQPSPTRILDVVGFVLDLAVVVLLAVRPSNRWFRPR